MLTYADADLSNLPLVEAVPVWKEIRLQRNLRERTHEATDLYFQQLCVFFGKMRLCDIKPGHLKEYQIARTENLLAVPDGHGGNREVKPWSRPCGPSIVNHEMSALSQLLKHCKLWEPLHLYYSPRKVQSWSPREVLSEEEEQHLFEVASGHPEVLLAYCVATITNNTSAAGCELRGLQLQHVFLREPNIGKNGVDTNPSEIYIPKEAVKNSSRPRKIPLNTTARWAVRECYKRALALGSCRPEHYLFPFRVKIGKYDPTKPPSRWWIRNNWNKLRGLAGLPGLCPHDLRHQCITRLLEAGVEPELVRSIAGHVNAKMMEYYSHVRLSAKFASVMAIEPTKFAVKRPVGKVQSIEQKRSARWG